MVIMGYGVSGSASYSKSKVNADYASVNEQSGIFAGDDGYRINVKNHTDLKGGLITSTDKAEKDGKNSFSTGTISFADIANRSEYSGSSFGVGLSGSMGGGESMPKEVGGMKLNSYGNNKTVSTPETNADGSYKTKEVGTFSMSKNIGFGSDSDSQSSVTRSGINTANITVSNGEKQKQITGKSVEETIKAVKTDLTTDNYAANSGSLKNNFDAQEVQAEIDLQREVRQDFDQNRQNLKKDLYAIVDKKRAEAEKERKEHGGRETDKSKELDQEANKLYEITRWVDMGLGVAWGDGGTASVLGAYVETQADRAIMSAKTKQAWFQKIDPETGKVVEQRQIWSLADLTPEELAEIQAANGKVFTTSNPGIFNHSEASLKNADKQNLDEISRAGVIVVMNSPTGKYETGNEKKSWKDYAWLISSFPSELMYVGYDQINNKVFQGHLPITGAEELNQELYLQAKQMGWEMDTSNHSRGGITASVALKDLQNRGFTDIPIRKGRFYGTATNVQNDYADVLQKNKHTYTGADGKKYNSGAYSITHEKDFVGNKWIPFFLGNNKVSEYNNCKGYCYSHGSYYANVPKQGTKEWEDFVEKWGKPKMGDDGTYTNHAIPKLVYPNKPNGETYEENPF